ncbi:MAG: MBL fold metallo-hydrolase [Burkholderiaceae bacterium]|nr:MBL fold metallo-hydrolase [Burkholderiaceae bacterium]
MSATAKTFFRIRMLPALHGDCLWIEYGAGKRTRRVLIDGGPIGAWSALESQLKSLPAGDRRIELVVLTHVDTDHVDGLVRLFAEPPPWPFTVRDVWFNGWRHMEQAHGLLGGRQGEFFSALLAQRFDAGQWNRAFDGGPVAVRGDAPLPRIELAGGLALTLLSPTPATLDRMRDAWRKDVRDFDPGDLEAAWAVLARQKKYLPADGLLGSTPELDELLEKQSRPDNAAANGSSIAFLAELAAPGSASASGDPAGKSVLFLADAHPDVVCESLRRLLGERGQDTLHVDAVKVAHHGSKANTTDELMSLVRSPKFLVSTNGGIFGHPDAEAVQRIVARSLVQPPVLVFNYRCATNEAWGEAGRQRELGFEAVFAEDDDGITVEL